MSIYEDKATPLWPAERLRKLSRLRIEGRTWREVGKVLGVSEGSVRKVGERMGLIPDPFRTITEFNEDRDKILIEKYPTAHTPSLAKELGITPRQVRTRANRLGLTKTPEHRTTLGSNRLGPQRCTHPLYKELGNVSIRKSGPMVKTPAGQWVKLARAIWEYVGNKVPKNHVVVYKQGKEKTPPHKLTLDDIECIPRSEQSSRLSRARKKNRSAESVQTKVLIRRPAVDTSWSVNRPRSSSRSWDFNRRTR